VPQNHLHAQLGLGLRLSTSIKNYLHNFCIINVHPLYRTFEVKTYGLSRPFTLPIHVKFWMSFFENIFYKDLIFDKWKKKNIDLKFSLQNF